jgi:hypothetical protein
VNQVVNQGADRTQRIPGSASPEGSEATQSGGSETTVDASAALPASASAGRVGAAAKATAKILSDSARVIDHAWVVNAHLANHAAQAGERARTHVHARTRPRTRARVQRQTTTTIPPPLPPPPQTDGDRRQHVFGHTPVPDAPVWGISDGPAGSVRNWVSQFGYSDTSE